jgi:ATP-binding cassette subfamily F protein 3
MSLVVLENAGLEFGGRTIFSGLGLRVGEEDRVGVVGRNGSGKSSLLKIIAGAMEPNTGVVRGARGLRIGYLPQEIDVRGGKAVLDTVLGSVPGRTALEDMLADVEVQLERATDEGEQIALAQKLADLHEDLGHFETTYSRHEALSILVGLGFDQADMARDVGELSGGWRMRGVLASLLFQRPDLLLLDEPTNHLDVPSVAWLAAFLARWRGAFLLITHDREFLNEQVSRIVGFEPDGVRQYGGNYEAYVAARAEELTILERRAANLAREREQAERFIRRFRAQATKARAVQSRVKMLERMETIELPSDERSLTFRFPPCERTGQDVFALQRAGHSYGDHRVFSNVELVARRGERIAIVGANGNGKTTLLKILGGQLRPSEGTVRLGHNVKVGYYAQHVTERLDLRSTVFEEVWRDSAVEDLTQVRNALGTMLFSGDDVDKLVGVLSGGEKARVSLAKLLVNPGNAILMDEPTNHLDLESSEALAAALETFGGTLLFVSHNRSFVRRLATRIWNVENGAVEEYPGTFDDYMERCRRLERERERAVEERVASVAAGASPVDSARPVTTGTAPPRPAGSQPPAQRKSAQSAPGAASSAAPAAKDGRATASRRTNAKGTRALERKIADIEERIAALEKVQAERSAELSKPETYADPARYGELLGAYQADAAKLEELMVRWERTQADLTAGA